MTTNRLWLLLALVMAASFAVLGLQGREIHRMAPPIPTQVVAASGDVLFTREDIQTGQLAWQSMGGQQVGSIWGHGGYVAPDWSADQLHRESVALLDIWAGRDFGMKYSALDGERQAGLKARLKAEMRTNTHDPATGVITVSDDRAAAIREVQAHYTALLSDDPALESLREDYAIANNPVPDAGRRNQISAFYWWTSWGAGTNRPDSDITYTSNWPHEPLIDNVPTSANIVWSVASVLLLIFGVAALVFWHASTRKEEHVEVPTSDPLGAMKPTPSMKATGKYFLTVIALFLVQVGLGAVTAHYAVEGHDFYGIPISEWIPYAITRTWHTQIAIFWIATAWLATGLYIAPMVSGHEPRFQKLGVNILYAALLLVVVGLLLWLVLVGRALWPALKKPNAAKPVLVVLFLSTIAIALMYAAGFMWGKHTHISMVEYWRWWIVHLWVEGFFEVFATAVIGLLFVRLGLVRAATANLAVMFGTIVFMTGGVLGTLHHLYFAGTPVSVLAIGSMFSALEVVPLALVGFEAFENWRHTKAAPWVKLYKWPIMFFVAVAFWNLLGAGVFGFMINPPLSLYYIQGLNTTATHAHAALFGVYGMLGIGLLLFCFRSLARREAWSDRLLAWTFWLLNGGLALMVFLSLLPVGVIQAFASIEHGVWYARSPAVIHSPIVEMLVWMRMPGDVMFSIGALTLAIFAGRLVIGAMKPAPVSVPGSTDLDPATAPAE